MTAARPWMKFYPRDWRADEKLRDCSLAARGLWIEMIALMHGSERYGRLLIAGKATTNARLAIQVGASEAEVDALLEELREAGVFSVDASGIIYSRRMKEDEKAAENARKNGKKGGNPKLGKQRENSEGDKGQDKGGLKDGDKLRGQKADKNPSGKKQAIPLSDDWEPKPFKGGKCKAIIDGWNADEFDRQVARFKAHHRGRGNKWVSWQDAWETWVLGSTGFSPQKPKPSEDGEYRYKPLPRYGRHTTEEIIREAEARLAQG